MSIAISSVTRPDSRHFNVNGSLSPGGQAVTCQAFIGSEAAGPASSQQVSADGPFSITVSLNNDYASTNAYTVRATDQKGDVAEMTLPYIVPITNPQNPPWNPQNPLPN